VKEPDLLVVDALWSSMKLGPSRNYLALESNTRRPVEFVVCCRNIRFLAAGAWAASGPEIVILSIAFAASYFIVWSGAATGSHLMARIRRHGQTG